MSDNYGKVKICKKDKLILTKENLEKLSREELIDKVLQLEAYNGQLKNILKKKNNDEFSLNNEFEIDGKRRIDFDKVSKRHVLLKFYYLGWNYQGFVVQEDTISTIEFYLFKALQKCCLIESREKCNYHRCGRTDKGVSAFSQVISLDLRSKLSEPNEENVSEEFPYCKMLNRLLPDDIKCYAWCHVGANTSARFDCSSRLYKYYFPRGDLNIELMQEGAKHLVGVKDFRNLCKMDVGNGVTEFLREITFVEIKPCLSSISTTNELSGYNMFELIIKGKSFLWHQIRCIMSVLLLIGQGKESPDVVKDLLNVEENPSKPQYTPANDLPLNLYEVEYEGVPTQWIVDEQDLCKTIELLQSQWTTYSIKCSMIKNIIEDLERLRKSPEIIQKQAEPLADGVKPKIYKPLLSRMKCETLENKISHYIKKRKIEVVEIDSEAPS